MSQDAQWPPHGGGGAGTVTDVTATSPIASSGGTTPNISLTGVVDTAHGGTGLSSPGTSGNVLTSNGTIWTSAAPAASGVTTMGAFGSSPNANAGTISGNTLTLQPASASFPGGISTTTQSLAGLKTFVDGANISTSKNLGFSADPSKAYITDEGSGTMKFHSDGGHLNMYVDAAETVFLGFSNKLYFHTPASVPNAFYCYGGNGNIVLGCNSDLTTIMQFTKGYSQTWLATKGTTAGFGFTFSDGTNATNDDLDTRMYSPAVNQITIQAGGVDVIKTTATTVNLPLLTASLPVVSDASKNLVSLSYASFAGNLPHASLSGLTTTDAGHTQFAMLAGRSGGQVLNGGSATGNDFTLVSNSTGTKGNIFLGVASTTTGIWVKSDNTMLLGPDVLPGCDLQITRTIDLDDRGGFGAGLLILPDVVSTTPGGVFYGAAIQPIMGDGISTGYGALFSVASDKSDIGGNIYGLNLTASMSGTGTLDDMAGGIFGTSASDDTIGEEITSLIAEEPSYNELTKRMAFLVRGTWGTEETVDAASTGTVNTYPATASFFYLSNIGGGTLNGIAGGKNGKRVLFHFASNWTINNASGSAATGEKIFTSSGAAIIIVGPGSFECVFSEARNGWAEISSSV